MGLGIQIQVGIAKMYFTHYKNMLHSKFPLLFTVIQFIIIGRGLGQSQAKPSRSQQLWPGSGFCQAKAPKSQAKALKARPSRAVHNPSWKPPLTTSSLTNNSGEMWNALEMCGFKKWRRPEPRDAYLVTLLKYVRQSVGDSSIDGSI